MADAVDHLIVGGGMAGVACAEALRAGSPEASIAVVSREPDPPYDRTAASKGYLRGELTRQQALLRSPSWWEEQRIDLLARTSVMKLDPTRRVATLSTKRELEFERALIATGALVRRLRVPGSDLDGIHYLRSLRNSDAIRADLDRDPLGNSDAIRRDADGAGRAVMIGGSYIGCEVAASLTAIGVRCAIVMQESVVLERSFGAAAGRFFQERLERHGVEVVGDDELAGFEGDGRVTRVLTRRGRSLEADLVVIGAGVIPDVMLARSAGLSLGASGGIVTDERLETSAPGVFAAGDVCEYPSGIHERALRIEHWEVAAAQGRRAAAGMLGASAPPEEVPYFFADLADWVSLEYVGPAREWDSEVVHGDLESGRFSVWYLAGRRVAAVLSVGGHEDLERGRELIAARGEVDP